MWFCVYDLCLILIFFLTKDGILGMGLDQLGMQRSNAKWYVEPPCNADGKLDDPDDFERGKISCCWTHGFNNFGPYNLFG